MGYAFQHGDFAIEILSDGHISIPADMVVAAARPEERAGMLERLAPRDGSLEINTNIPLIRTGADIILVDVGAGPKYQPTDGHLSRNLAATSLAPEAVTKVVFSHAHPDHIWGTIAEDGRLRFPNAIYYVGEMEWAFRMDPDYATTMPAGLHDLARGAQRDLGAIADRVVLLKPGQEVVTGMRALDTAGHTPGHLSFELSGEAGLIITADAATNQIVSFEHPEWSFGYDTIPDLAIRNRVRLGDRAAGDRVKLLGYHWAYPGIGHVERGRDGAHFLPI